ncbi:hypothetical protein D4Q80_03410 [bacterium]|nr:MAG: hypothetical protein D4Q80_03410 [bacterium]
MNPEIFYFDECVKNLFEFESLLKAKKLNIKHDSEFEKISYTILEVQEIFKEAKKAYDNKIDNRESYRKMAGLNDILRKIIYLKDNPDFEQLLPHIRLLFSDSKIVQNIWSPKEDQVSNKLYEFFIALIVMRVGSDLEIEDPNDSGKGGNPDVIISIDGIQWGFACKVMHSSSAKSYIDRLKDGIDQIKRSNVKRGIVTFNLKNLVNHDGYWPVVKDPNSQEISYVGFDDYEGVVNDLRRYAYKKNDIVHSVFDDNNDEIIKLFSKTNVCPTTLLFIPTVTSIAQNGLPIITLIRSLVMQPFLETAEDDRKVIEKINYSLHDRYL